nr:hypothetical protein [Sicyoidochytrium minutum DNA virus]
MKRHFTIFSRRNDMKIHFRCSHA